MRRALRLSAFFAFLFMMGAAAAFARGVTAYVQRVVITDPGDIRLGDLVQTFGDTPAPARETLALAVATLSDHLLYIPSRLYRDQAETAFGRDSIFVGSRSLVIPRGAVPDNEVPLLDRFVDFLGEAGVLGSDLADLAVRSIQLNGTVSPDAAPTFKLVRSSGGSIEASFTASAGNGAPASGRIILALKGDQHAAAPDIRPSDPVRVVFHKGPITIEMQGKAQGQAAVGDMVNVMVSDSQKSFTGRLLAGKAVDVELP